MKPIDELTDEELTEACTVEIMGWRTHPIYEFQWVHSDGERLVYEHDKTNWRPLTDMNDAIRVKMAAEKIICKRIIFGEVLTDPGMFAAGVGDREVFFDSNQCKALCLCCLSAVCEHNERPY